LVLSEAGNFAIPLPAQKTFDAKGEALEHALTKSFRMRNNLRNRSWNSRYHAVRIPVRSAYPL
jgi:hypothetical protein